MTKLNITAQLKAHQSKLKLCTACGDMQGPPVHGKPINSSIMLIGQAPGPREIDIKKPFAWTAGKTLFSWFEQIGCDEIQFRNSVYMTAVCRCFPGKANAKSGGDRVPSKIEIQQCQTWLHAEINILNPKLIIPVGKLAISQFRTFKKLTDVIGSSFNIKINEHKTKMIPLPHPSGVSTWFRTEPGKSLLLKALSKIKANSAWKNNI